MDGRLAPWLAVRTKQEIYKLCLEKRVPFAPVRNMAEVVNDAHLKARDYFVEITHPVAGTFKYPGAPGKLSETPWAVDRPAPLLGQHNEEIYCKRLGYSKEKLETLRTGGII
jgi:crotonobetainyl-CoA:carnitine CoA-transferase CaiB-like acyl-CoA transferase